jgi:Ca2+-binding RTX toxin-like protein
MRLAMLAAAVVLLVWAPGAGAALPQQSGGVDLLNQGFAQWDGPIADGHAGAGLAALGDVNGDGRRDYAVSSPSARNADGAAESGVTYVFFAPQPGGAPIDLTGFGSRGLRIEGGEQFLAGHSVDSAGDVNGDGLADVLITSGQGCAGGIDRAAYVIFGRRAPGRIDLTSLGTSGFRICAPAVPLGIYSAAGVGDVNGDGRGDVIAGVPNDGGGDGAAYVVFGSGSSADVDLAALGSRGYRLAGNGTEAAGSAVSSAGDLNGDGRADVFVGAPQADTVNGNQSGAVYAAFGKPGTAAVNLGALGAGGYRILGGALDDFAGGAIANLGDVNGDRRSDVLIGAVGVSRDAVTQAGAAYVVFGRSSTIEITLGGLGSGGYRLRGPALPTEFASSLAAIGDVNGDGRGDMAIGAPEASPNGRLSSGSVHVVYGRASGDVDAASAPQTYGYRVDGAAPGDRLGGREAPSTVASDAIAGGSDINGDARPDLLVGSPSADNNARSDSGSAYAVLGFGEPALGYGSLRTRVGANVVHPPFIVRRTHTATYSLEGALPRGLSLNRSTGAIVGTPTAGAPDRPYGIRITDAAGTATTLVRIHVVSAPRPRACTNGIRGTNRRNTLRGTDLGDNMWGLRGNDRLFGGLGDDCLRGGKGNDRLSAGPGRDRLRGDSGNDTFLGSSGNDAINGGSGKDRANGGGGRDTYTMGSGNDRITTADGVAERVYCGRGRDRVVAADRGDRLRGCERVRRN